MSNINDFRYQMDNLDGDNTKSYLDYAKNPYVYMASIPILVLLVLLIMRPSFCMTTVEDPKTKAQKKSINFKRMLLVSVIIGAIGAVAIYYFLIRNKQQTEA